MPKAQKASQMTEDEVKKSHDDIQKLTDAFVLKVDEIIALTDPTNKKGEKKGKDKSSGGSPMGAVSGSGGGK